MDSTNLRMDSDPDVIWSLLDMVAVPAHLLWQYILRQSAKNIPDPMDDGPRIHQFSRWRSILTGSLCLQCALRIRNLSVTMERIGWKLSRCLSWQCGFLLSDSVETTSAFNPEEVIPSAGTLTNHFLLNGAVTRPWNTLAPIDPATTRCVTAPTLQ